MSAIDLDRRISRALERGRGIKLNDADLDTLAQAGAIDALRRIAADELREKARCRDAQRQRASIREVPTGSIGTEGRTANSAARTSPSSGMTPDADGLEALQRVREMLPKAKPRLTATT